MTLFRLSCVVAAAALPGAGGGSQDDVVDAEFTEVKDDDKK